MNLIESHSIPNESGILPADDQIIDLETVSTIQLIRWFDEADRRDERLGINPEDGADNDPRDWPLNRDINVETKLFPLDYMTPQEFKVVVYGENGATKLDKKALVKYLGHLRIVSDGPQMYQFDGRIYQPIKDVQVEAMIEEILDSIPNAPFITRSAKADVVASLKSLYRRDNIATPDSFWEDERYQSGDLIPFQNGLYNIQRDELEPFTPFLFITHVLGAYYFPAIDQHPVEAIYKKILPDDSTRTFFYEMVGFTLYSERLSPPALFVIYGPGNTGKTALQEAVATLAGRENVSYLDLGQISEGFMTAELHGKLLNVCGETGSGLVNGVSKSDGELLKRLSDGQTIKVQRKYAQPFDMVNTAKLWFVSNTLPDFGDTSSGLYRRLHIVPCRVAQRWEDQIYSKMQEDSAISWLANKALVAYLDFIARGNHFLDSDVMVREAQTYRTQEPLMDWLESYIGTLEPAMVANNLDQHEVRELYAEYRQYVEQTGGRPLSSRKFAERIRNEYRLTTYKTRGLQPNGSPTTVTIFDVSGWYKDGQA